MNRKFTYFLLASFLAFIHILAADILFFYGTVIDPQIQHQILNAIAFIALLPFRTLMLIPGIGDFFIIVQIFIYGFWIAFYYWISSRILRNRKCWCLTA